MWPQARPTLWRYGDASNLYPGRALPEGTLLLPQEWMRAVMLREEMEYTLPTDETPIRVRRGDGTEPEVNRFAEALADAARLGVQGGLQSILSNKDVPLLVREALNAMQIASQAVIGTDGHRRLCRHEGWAYMALFGPPLIFCTPNLADSKQPLLLVVEGVELRLDSDVDDVGNLPKYREMMQRLPRDPVGQTRVFELMMRLFFLHVLGVRPECLRNRSGSQEGLHALGATSSSSTPTMTSRRDTCDGGSRARVRRHSV